MSVTIKEHLVGTGGNNVYETSGDIATQMRVSNTSINRAALEARRVSTGPMALSKITRFSLIHIYIDLFQNLSKFSSKVFEHHTYLSISST